jgi:hypothetical protein
LTLCSLLFALLPLKGALPGFFQVKDVNPNDRFSIQTGDHKITASDHLPDL